RSFCCSSTWPPTAGPGQPAWPIRARRLLSESSLFSCPIPRGGASSGGCDVPFTRCRDVGSVRLLDGDVPRSRPAEKTGNRQEVERVRRGRESDEAGSDREYQESGGRLEGLEDRRRSPEAGLQQGPRRCCLLPRQQAEPGRRQTR